ncbi:MAG: DegV family protein, partial [Oscillospiraceae bacterium]|nr:DegV family protein [Oscillospiraceae bacterium]
SLYEIEPVKGSGNHVYTEDGTEYLDGVNIFNKDIYDFQENGKTLKTSLPSGNSVINTLNRIAADGYDGVIAVMLSSGLSGTYNFVKMLAEERKDFLIEVFDSRNASLGLAMILLRLAEDIKTERTGMSLYSAEFRSLLKIPFHSFPLIRWNIYTRAVA